RTGCTDGLRQVRPQQVLPNALYCGEVKDLVLHHRTANRAAELLAVKVLERLAVRGVRGQPLETLIVKQAAMRLVGPRLRDDVVHSSSGAAELGVGAGGDDLEF